MAASPLRAARIPALRLALIGILVLAGWGAGAEGGREGVAAPWIAAIQRSLDEGRPSEAVETARAALQDLGTDSDLHLLLSRALLAAKGEVRPALAEVEAALRADAFSGFSADEARLLEASLLLRLRRPSEALALLAGLEGKGSDSLLLRLRALLFSGLGAARADFDEARRSYPDDPRFARLFFGRASLAGDPWSRELADFYLRRLSVLSAADPDLPIAALPFVAPTAERKHLLEGYLAQGGKAGILQALEYGLVRGSAALGGAFARTTPLDAAFLRGLAAALGGGEGEAALHQALEAFSGTITEDRDGDGFPETWTAYASGRPLSWSLDSDQDGVMDLVVDFRFGEPEKALSSAGPASRTFTWSGYPYLDQVVIHDSDGGWFPDLPLLSSPSPAPERRYLLVAETLAYRPFRVEALPGQAESFTLLVDRGEVPPSDQAALAAARDLSLLDGGRTIDIKISGGLAVSGTIELGGAIRGRLAYDHGRPQTESLDRDGDGSFESGFELDPESPPWAPKALSLGVDLDGDGKAEYRESFIGDRRKTWDYDGDGRPDAIETQAEDGTVTRRFSSRLDGIFDEGIVLSPQGRLISVLRQGRAVILVPDANPLVKWMGSKPFDLGAALPAGEGIHERGGRRYRLLKAGQIYLAEPLP